MDDFRSENIDVWLFIHIYSQYKELLRRREDQKKKLQRNKNPFILCIYLCMIIEALPTTNEDVYKQLYKFDANSELDEYKFSQQ